jgi:G:T/U-mismatch repair DNA glycosylase
MLVIGCDYHLSVQHIAWIDTETGECGERQLRHGEGKAEKFYRDLKAKGVNVRVGIEATGHARWFERLQTRTTATQALTAESLKARTSM